MRVCYVSYVLLPRNLNKNSVGNMASKVNDAYFSLIFYCRPDLL